jgi:hypothetical protein
MPKVKISEFSATPANNTDIDGINIAEGCAPSGINDAIRELMAQLKDFQVGSAGDPVTVGGVLTVTAGAVGTPAITTAGDTNTGIFFPAADTIAFAEGGVEAARFDSNGNLGIGITSPAYKLQVVSGTTTPAARFQYAGTATLQPTVTLRNTADGNGYISQLDLLGQNAAGTDQISFIASQTNTSGTVPNLLFGMRVSGSYTERARIDSSGNLLVGTTSAVSGGGILQVSNGITFPATQSASSNANTLDDYEEGTFTPNQGGGLTVVGTFSSTGTYTKIGNLVNVQVSLSGSTSIAIGGADAIIFTNLPFTTANRSPGEAINIGHTAGIFTSTASSTVYSCGALAATSTIFLSITYRV